MFAFLQVEALLIGKLGLYVPILGGPNATVRLESVISCICAVPGIKCLLLHQKILQDPSDLPYRRAGAAGY